jgi:hypothetical protein
MKTRRVLGTAIGTLALAFGGLAVSAGTASAEPPFNYGNCVAEAGFAPQYGGFGPLNSEARDRTGKNVGAANGYSQSGGESRFDNAFACAF